MSGDGNQADSVQNKVRESGMEKTEIPQKSKKVLDAGQTCLYRHFDANGVLLYIGISLSAVARLRTHRRCSHWSDEIAAITVYRYPTRAQAEMAERLAISHEKPLHNKRLNWCPIYDFYDAEEHAEFLKREAARAVALFRDRQMNGKSARIARLRKEAEQLRSGELDPH